MTEGTARTRRPTARHESGHAVCAWATGLTVERIVLQMGTFAANEITMMEFDDEVLALRAMLTNTFAGAEAEFAVSKKSRNTPAIAIALSADLELRVRALSRLVELIPAAEVKQALRDASVKARRLVRQFRPAIDALTDELSARRRVISGADAREIAFGACPELAEAYRNAERGK
jgi:hypothetical protein